MKKIFLYVLILLAVTTACDDFLNPKQGLVMPEGDVPQDEVELRSMSLGLYSLQQELVEQIVILGELRGDLLTVTDNADADLREIIDFQVSENNRYASPSNFYKLIAACNKMIRILEVKYPQVTSDTTVIDKYHRMYGEAIVMRSWSYFNAVRIYDEVPYIPQALTTIDEINDFVNSEETYIDSMYIDYKPDGISTDTIIKEVFLERQFFDQDMMTRKCLDDIEQNVRVVGVNYSEMDQINDETWNITVWNEDALKAFQIQMYMHLNNYTDALDMLNKNFLRLNVENTDDYRIKYAIDREFQNNNWKKIFTSIDGLEHIFTLQFQKTSATWQLNPLQSLFSIMPPSTYSVKPTNKAITLWESQWQGYEIQGKTNPSVAYTEPVGISGDFYRGYGQSYTYVRNGVHLSETEVKDMLALKQKGYWDEVNDIMRGVDTVAYKYTIDKGPFDKDANFNLYRAASMHLYAAELLCNRQYMTETLNHDIVEAEFYIYNGDYLGSDNIGTPPSGSNVQNYRLGVAGRVGFDSKEGITVDAEGYFDLDPYSNEVLGYIPFNGMNDKQLYMEQITMDQRARELAYEGERFYDYIRIARRREQAGNNGVEWLAESISQSYPADQRASIKSILSDQNNWYLPFILK